MELHYFAFACYLIKMKRRLKTPRHDGICQGEEDDNTLTENMITKVVSKRLKNCGLSLHQKRNGCCCRDEERHHHTPTRPLLTVGECSYVTPLLLPSPHRVSSPPWGGAPRPPLAPRCHLRQNAKSATTNMMFQKQ